MKSKPSICLLFSRNYFAMIFILCFKVEDNKYCQWDKVKVLDSNGTIIKEICGYLEQDLVIYSTGNNMTVELHTDGGVNSAGFLASWESIDQDVDTEVLSEVSNESYVLSFPQTFSVNAETEQDQLCLQMLNLKSNGKVTLSLFEGKNLVSGEASDSKEVEVEAGDEAIHCHHLKLPADFDNKYAVVGIKGDINGYKLLSFKSVRTLKAKPLVLIQTDKYDYRPKQDVNVRMLLMNEDLKPTNAVQMIDEIWIEDPSGSRLHQWKDVELKQGLAQVTPYKLTDEAALGKWTVKASFTERENVTTTKEVKFEVNENTLPSFEVTIDAPKYMLRDSKQEIIQVCAKYTHGAKVKGQANVTISYNSNIGNRWRPRYVPVVLFNDLVPLEDGCSKLEFNSSLISSILNKKLTSYPKVFAEVKESATGEKQNATHPEIVVKDTPFEIDAGTSPAEYIISGFPYVGHFHVQDHAGKAMPNVVFDVCTRLYSSLEKMKNFVTSTSHQFYNYNEEQFFQLSKVLSAIKYKETCMEATSNANGKLNFAISMADIQVPKNITKMSLYISAKDFSANDSTGMKQPVLTHDITLTHSNASSGITIQASNEKLSCGENEVELFISGPAETSIELTHFIASGGAMLASESTSVDIGTDDASETFVGDATPISFELDAESRTDTEKVILKKYKLKLNRPLPTESGVGLEEFKLLAYVRDAKTGETLTADQDFTLEKCNVDNIAIKFSAESVRPGSTIAVDITGPSKGYCGYR